MQMQFFALGGKCGFPRAEAPAPGCSAANIPSPRINSATASKPMPLAFVAKKSRRDCSAAFRNGFNAFPSLPRDEFIEIQKRAGQRDPGSGLGCGAFTSQLPGFLRLCLVEQRQFTEKLGGAR